MGNAIEDQQVSCLWQGEYMLSVSVSGNINYLDKNNPDKPIRTLKVCCLRIRVRSPFSTSYPVAGSCWAVGVWSMASALTCCVLGCRDTTRISQPWSAPRTVVLSTLVATWGESVSSSVKCVCVQCFPYLSCMFP